MIYSKMNASVATDEWQLGQEATAPTEVSQVLETSVCIQVDLSMMKMNLKHKMKTEVSIVDRIDGLGAVKTEKSYQQLSHRESVGEHRMKEYNYERSQGNNLSTIRD